MSNADILREMTCIIAALCRLEQLGAATMEEEKAAVAKRIAAVMDEKEA